MIGILTFHWADDFGAMLQAYALKRRLEELAGGAEIIPYAPVKLTGRYWLYPVHARVENGKLRMRRRGWLLLQNLSVGRCFLIRRRRMRHFRRKYLTAEKPVFSAGSLSLEKYDIVFVGSDQIWNPDITVDLDDAYVGNIPRKGKCRFVSYGASISGHVFSKDEEEKLKRCVGGCFSQISLRERADAGRLERLLGRKVWDVLDPSLLLKAPQWKAIARTPARKDYILLYLTEDNPALLHCAQALAARLEKEIISLSPPWDVKEAAAGAVKIQFGIGPEEFLGYIQNAGCVLTNSFHATVFSVLMEKPFLTFRHRERNIRLMELLQGLGLSALMVEEIPLDEIFSLWKSVDWEETRRRLAEKREASERFILGCLGKYPW